MPASLGFMVKAIKVLRLRKESIVIIAACSVRSNCLLYLVVVSIDVLSHTITCPVVREWLAGADVCGRSH